MKKEKENLDVAVNLESLGKSDGYLESNLKPLTLEEKKYLVAVGRGDAPRVRRMLRTACWKPNLNINCVDLLGRGAISLAIENENLEMLELLIVMGADTKDALLHAINSEFVEAVELLLEHEELIHRTGEPHSWETIDWEMRTFSPDTTPIILAAQRNNYEITKILLDRGAALPMPHAIKYTCGCDICIEASANDSLRFSLSRLNEYRALASPSLIALSSKDPIVRAFQLSWDLKRLASAEQESKSEYLELQRRCQQFAVDLLNETRSSQELALILNHDGSDRTFKDGGDQMKLTKLKLAVHLNQKKFVAHPNIQQLLAALWYEGLPGFRRKTLLRQCIETIRVAVLFPLFCLLYWMAPMTETARLIRKPFMKFLIHASSYVFFLFVLILVSQKADTLLLRYIAEGHQIQETEVRQRGNPPTFWEWLLVSYIAGFVWEGSVEMYNRGVKEYLRDLWNTIDFTRNLLYVLVILLRISAYFQQISEISLTPSSAFIPREDWDDFDFQLISEGFFAAGNIFSALKLIKIFSINPYLGPLEISFGRMIIDIVKFFFMYTLVLFSFACGLNQLLGYFAELERRKCYSLPNGLPDWQGNADSCTKWRRFGNLFEASQSLFWASFGMIGIDSFDLTGIKTYTRFWSLLMFGLYSVISIIVLLNLLIAMMSNSYAIIEKHSDVEWKFSRTKLWMSYFDDVSTLPPPFNIIPSPKFFFGLFKFGRSAKSAKSLSIEEQGEEVNDDKYAAVMKALIRRYVSGRHKQTDESQFKEDDLSQIKTEVKSAKHELLKIMKKNGLDVSNARDLPKRNKTHGKKMKIWERQLMKDFHVVPTWFENPEESSRPSKSSRKKKNPFLRLAHTLTVLAASRSKQEKPRQSVGKPAERSKIGRGVTNESIKNKNSLRKAMIEARKLVSLNSEEVTSFPVTVETPEPVVRHLEKLAGEQQQDFEEVEEQTPNLSERGLVFPTANEVAPRIEKEETADVPVESHENHVKDSPSDSY